MAIAERCATALWEGNLTEGRGRFSVGSGAISEQSVSGALAGNVKVNVHAELEGGE